MKNPSVSIITPSYEQGEYLEDNLQSVRDQSAQDIEHIVVDGGSTDETVELLQKYSQQYNLEWISESDRGQSDAINKGIQRASGEWICWINSDDYLLNNAIDSFMRVESRQESSDVIYGDFIFVDKDGNKTGKKYNTQPSPFVHKHYYQFTGNHCTFFRKGVLDELGGVNEMLDYTMDTELFWRILVGNYRLTHVPVFFGARRLHEQAKTTGDLSEKQQDEIEYLKQQYSYSLFESCIPDKALTYMAFGLQALLHLQEGRPEALPHMVK